MALPYVQPNEINDRYVGSIIFIGNTPIIVDMINMNGELEYTEIGGDRRITNTVNVLSPELRDGPFQLGYVNGISVWNYDENDNRIEKLTTKYCARMPIRQWKQGLSQHNLHFQPGPNLAWGKLVSHKGFRDMLIGDYPALKKAVVSLNEAVASVAFNRRLAVSLNELEEVQLHHRGYLIGASDDGNKFRLGKPYVYFKEWLLTQGVKIW